jgi:hypothetical protein
MREQSKRHREKSITRNSGLPIYPPTSFLNDFSIPRDNLRKKMPSSIFGRAVTQTCANPYKQLTTSVFQTIYFELLLKGKRLYFKILSM